MIKEEREAIRARLAGIATEPPWEAMQPVGDPGAYVHQAEKPWGNVALLQEAYPECSIYLEPGDANFIAHAPEDVRRLLAEIERLQDALRFYALMQRGKVALEAGDGCHRRIYESDLGAAARAVLNGDPLPPVAAAVVKGSES